VLAIELVVAAAELDVAAAELVVGADEDVAAALDVGAALDVAAALDEVAPAVVAALPQAASSEALARPAAPPRANRITCRRRNGAPVTGCKSDMVSLSSLNATLHTTRVPGAVRHKTAGWTRLAAPLRRPSRSASSFPSVYDNARRRLGQRGHTGTHNLFAR
jgi:hypothetical protein